MRYLMSFSQPFKPSCKAGKPITKFGSINAFYSSLLAENDTAIGCIVIGPKGRLGMHKATESQLFYVIEGKGWVRTGSEPIKAIAAGEMVFWKMGDDHESSSDDGMKVLILEAEHLDPSALIPGS